MPSLAASWAAELAPEPVALLLPEEPEPEELDKPEELEELDELEALELPLMPELSDTEDELPALLLESLAPPHAPSSRQAAVAAAISSGGIRGYSMASYGPCNSDGY